HSAMAGIRWICPHAAGRQPGPAASALKVRGTNTCLSRTQLTTACACTSSVSPVAKTPSPWRFDCGRLSRATTDTSLVRLGPYSEGDGLVRLIDRMNALPNWRQRWCTRILKIEPTIAYLKINAPCVQYVGLRADEETREGIYGSFEGVE